MMNQQTVDKLTAMANRMRENAIELAYKAGKSGAHLGGGLSAVEIMACLYGYAMNISEANKYDSNRDRFILSKGHGTLAYYTALQEAGLLSREMLYTFENNGGDLPGQPMRNLNLGIEVSSGSLGMGFPIGVGLALAAKLNNRKNYVYSLIGDGECNEGSIWEAAMSAINFGLTNIVAIVDCNGLQSDGECDSVLHTSPLKNMWEGFGWHVIICENGHDVRQLCNAFDECKQVNKPCVILAKTIKGKGVSFMENNKNWHHGALSQTEYEVAIKEVSDNG